MPRLNSETLSRGIGFRRASVKGFTKALVAFLSDAHRSPKGVFFEIAEDAIIRHVDLVS